LPAASVSRQAGTVIRQLGPDDWQLLRSVRLAALLDAPEAFAGTYADAVERDEAGWRTWPGSGAVFAAVDDGDQPLGMVAVMDDDGAELIAMWVAPAGRGTGLADELIQTVLRWAGEHGHDHVDLEIAPGNERARRVYLRNGFVETDEPGRFCGDHRFRVVTADRAGERS
jgi:RimJ/RimL family protein N-acetyltransferase